jgi:3-hydroxybutyryl-CoA dehydrogenase
LKKEVKKIEQMKTSPKNHKTNVTGVRKSELLPKTALSPEVTEHHSVLVFIIGESPMVEQYANICTAHGYDVCVTWNEYSERQLEFKSPRIKFSNIIPKSTSIAIELTNTDHLTKKKNLEKLAKALLETAPILSSSITITATEQSTWIAGKYRLVGIAALPTFIEKPLVEVAPTIYSPKETLEVVSRFFHSIDKEIEIVQDRVGMVLPRILCQVINEAAFAVTEDIAKPQDIDIALKLGDNFPFGPIEWAEQIGVKQVYAVLSALHADLQEERYRIAPLLKQMANTGEWWKQPSTN